MLNLKISKNRGICKHYNKKLFVRNYFWKCSEVVHLKINFVISDMEVYLVKFFLLNIYEATGLLDLEKSSVSLISYAYLIFFYKNYWPCLASISIVSVSIDFATNSQRDALFHCVAYDYFLMIGMVFMIIWEIFHVRISLKLKLLLLLVSFVSGFRL